MNQAGALPAPIRVGMIGASANPWAWAATAHVPALKSLPEFDLAAVASRDQARADAAAARHGIAKAYGSYDAMLNDPDLDMICVSTGSAYHFELVMAVIGAGKHVFCEWPFGRNINEAMAMRDAAHRRGVRTLVGLQTRYAPIVAYVRDLIAKGFVGKVYSVDLHRANDQTARMTVTPEYLRFLETANAGLRIMGGHCLDTLAAYVGEFDDLQAYMERGLSELRLTTGEMGKVDHKDQIGLQGRLEGGAVVSALLKQNSPTFKAFQMEISGSSGAIVVATQDDLDPKERHPGVPFELSLIGTDDLNRPFRPLTVPDRYFKIPVDTPRGQPVDVAHMYRSFARALARGERCETDFDHGVMRHRLLEAIERAAQTGARTMFERS